MAKQEKDYKLAPTLAGGATAGALIGGGATASREGLGYLANHLDGVANPDARTIAQRVGFHALRGGRRGALVGTGAAGVLYYRRASKKPPPRTKEVPVNTAKRADIAKSYGGGKVGRRQPTQQVAKSAGYRNSNIPDGNRVGRRLR